MNTEQVVEMIDAITEGKNYEFTVEGARESDWLKFQMASDSFSVIHDSRSFAITEIDDPRTAREIAGALVAWANRKEGNNQPGEKGKAFGIAMKGMMRPDENEGRRGVWRQDWYTRNVQRMSQETKNQNLKDLCEISDTQEMSYEERLDIEKAINILIVAGAK